MLVDGDRVRRDFGGADDIAGRLPWQPGSAAFVPELDPHPLSGDQDAVRAEAGRLFDAAGFTGGEVFKIDTINERVDAPTLAQLLQQELSAFNIQAEINPREYTEAVTLLTSGTFEHSFLGAGAWIRPGSPPTRSSSRMIQRPLRRERPAGGAPRNQRRARVARHDPGWHRRHLDGLAGLFDQDPTQIAPSPTQTTAGLLTRLPRSRPDNIPP